MAVLQNHVAAKTNDKPIIRRSRPFSGAAAAGDGALFSMFPRGGSLRLIGKPISRCAAAQT